MDNLKSYLKQSMRENANSIEKEIQSTPPLKNICAKDSLRSEIYKKILEYEETKKRKT